MMSGTWRKREEQSGCVSSIVVVVVAVVVVTWLWKGWESINGFDQSTQIDSEHHDIEIGQYNSRM